METPNVFEASISDDVLIGFYDRYAEQYSNGYPEVRNPSALNEGVATVVRMICDGELPDTVVLYVLEDDEDKKDPRGTRYVIVISRGAVFGRKTSYAIKLIYQDTREMESISTIEENHVVWSPDTISNSKHPLRTMYYLGFTYLICEMSPGFDIDPTPEKELTGAELIALGLEGDLPAEAIDIVIPENQEQETSESETIQIEDNAESLFDDSGSTINTVEAPWDKEEESFTLFDDNEENIYDENTSDTNIIAEEEPISQEDDTEIKLQDPDTYDYENVEEDYEELFG